MPRVIVTFGAQRGIRRCRTFLLEKSHLSANRASAAIKSGLLMLERAPEIGRPVPDRPGYRELLIPFGHSGYIALYAYERDEDTVHVASFRHQKEAEY